MTHTQYVIPLDRHHRASKSRDKTGLTRGELGALQALERAIARYRNPSLREIASCASTMTYASAIHLYLRRLEAKGYVRLPARHVHRSITLLRPAPKEEEVVA